jgi:hypothetical protein
MKIYLVSFGSQKFKKTLLRLKDEALKSNFFDDIILYTEDNIPGFINHHKYFIENNPKGFGFWICKSYATFKALNQIKDGDILVYLDAGCSINSFGKDRFNQYIKECINSPYKNISFQYEKYKEIQYTKEDIFNFLNIEQEHKESGQLIGGIFILQKCDFTYNLVEKWLYTCYKYNLIDNSIKLKCDNRFISNRNDQSIFSCLRKKLGTTIIENESDLDDCGNEKYQNNEKFIKYPFWATRLRY